MKNLAGAALVLIAATGYAQTEFQTDHRIYLEQLGTAKDSLYKTILARYDNYIDRNPADYAAGLERCKLIEKSFYDSYEDYNPNYDEAQSCAKDLSERFPDVPEVLLYQAEYMYGDSLVQFLKVLEVKAAVTNRETWQNYEWDVYHRLANHYRYSDQQSSEVIHYGILAAAANDTLDLSLMLAEAYKEESNNTTAIEVLLDKLDSTNDAWELNQKGRELLALGKPDEALRAFRWAAGKDEDVEDAGALAQAMIDQGIIEDARPYLLKDYIRNTQWQADGKLRALLVYDLRYGEADSAVVNYRKLTDENFINDPVGIYRLRLFAKAPLAAWSFADIGRVLLLIALLCLIFIIPYTWILPLHYWGTYRSSKGLRGAPTFQWGLRDLWVACALWLFCDVLGALLFNYEAAISVVSDAITGLNASPPVNPVVARTNVFFMTACTVFLFAMVKTGILKQIRDKFNAREIWIGVGLSFLLRFGLFIYVLFLSGLGVDVNATVVTASAITDAVISINTYYSPWLAFLFVVLLVPVYEEILFRGIFLSAAQRNLSFLAANIVQSLVFAAIHQDLTFFPFYFAFGMLAGHFTRQTGSLVTSVSMHIMNNLLAFVVIVVRH